MQSNREWPRPRRVCIILLWIAQNLEHLALNMQNSSSSTMSGLEDAGDSASEWDCGTTMNDDDEDSSSTGYSSKTDGKLT